MTIEPDLDLDRPVEVLEGEAGTVRTEPDLEPGVSQRIRAEAGAAVVSHLDSGRPGRQ